MLSLSFACSLIVDTDVPGVDAESAHGGAAAQSGRGALGGKAAAAEGGVGGAGASSVPGRESAGAGGEAGAELASGGNAGAAAGGTAGRSNGGSSPGGASAGTAAGGTAGRSSGGSSPGGASAGTSAQGGSPPTIDLQTNVDHCGASGRACGTTNVSARACAGGVCTSSCKTGYWNVTRPVAPAADDGCEASCPPSVLGSSAMVRINEYCIDRTEVSVAQYQSWLATNPKLTNPVARCNEKSSFVRKSVGDCKESSSDGPDQPVGCVDWCDAYAYCLGVGKHLCGARGGGGVSLENVNDASTSQWYNACTSGNAGNRFPYGATYQPNRCNIGGSEFSSSPSAVGSVSTCQSSVSGYQGVFDLVGNVSEWEDTCSYDESVSHEWCMFRGGAFASGPELGCEAITTRDGAQPGDATPSVGFRCCAL